MLDVVEFVVGDRPDAVDLACGAGAISERLLRRFPGARCSAIDLDPVLLKLGRSALGDMDGRLTWVETDLRKPDWAEGLPRRPADAVLSTTALHWLAPAELERLYQGVHAILRPGGVFLNGDEMAFSADCTVLRRAARGISKRDEAAERVRSHADNWESWWKEITSEPALAADLAVRAERFPRPHEDTPHTTLADHLRLLRAAGFREVETVWSWLDNRVFAGVA